MIFKAGLFSIFILFISPCFAMVKEYESKAIAAIHRGSHKLIMAELKAHKAAIEAEAGALIGKVAPQAGTMAGDIESGAKVVAAIAGMVPGGSSVAGVANDVEAIAAAVQQQSGANAAAIASTAGGSASSAAQGSALVAAALAAEKTAKSGSGVGSRVFAGLIAVGSLAGMGVLAYSDWFSTDTSSSENEDAQRAASYLANIPSFAGLLGVAVGSTYYAVTNKWFNDQAAKAEMTTQAVTNHVNTVTPLLAQKQVASSN